MKITIIAVGKIREDWIKNGIAEYQKRLFKFCKFEILEVTEEQAPENLSPLEIINVKNAEGEKILSKIRQDAYKISLVIDGKQLTSQQLAEHISLQAISGISEIAFIIGGSNGLSDEVINQSNLHLSFGKFTYPHQLMRLILAEQVYRAFKIINREPYHK
ncbi:MAG: 23S rRNA (pseudouridine(1915)-N(3))-methyltransferase RlmH [bacterium]